MKYFSRNFKSNKVSIIPLGDTHLGSRQCNEKFFKDTVDLIRRSKDTYWVGLGDFIENALVGSVGDIYEQTLSPREQIKKVEGILKPIRDKCLFLIMGNHEQRTTRVSSLMPTEQIAALLDVPFGGFSTYARFKVKGGYGVFTCYFHHNAGGGYTKGGKVNRANKLREIAPTADATFSGHMHTTSRIPVTWYEARNKGIKKCTGFDYIIGSALEYDESYAEMKAKAPANTEFIKVTFTGSTSHKGDNRKQEYSIITPGGSK